jgi:hypothetical protein
MNLGFRPNPGYQPDETIGKRVVVRMASGNVHGERPVNSDSKLGWAADTTRWTLTGLPFDVKEYRIL